MPILIHVVQIVETTTDCDVSTLAISNQPRGNETPVSTLKGRNLQALGLSCVHPQYSRIYLISYFLLH